MPGLTNKLKHIWSTDESWFYTDGIALKSHHYYWALSKDAVKPVIFQKYPIKVQVWAAVNPQYGIIGPYFFHKSGRNVTVNQFTYQECLQWFIGQLKQQRKFQIQF